MILQKYAQPRPVTSDKKRASGSHHRYLQAIPSVLEALVDPDRVVIFPEEHGACQIIRDFGSNVSAIDAFLKRVRVIPTAADINLVGIDRARALYGLGEPFPSLSDTAATALRMIVILLFCGRRVRCLRDVQVRDFQSSCFGGEEILDVFLCTTKVKSQGEFWLPLSSLVDDAELAFVQRWHQYTLGAVGGDAYLVGLALDDKIAASAPDSSIQKRLSAELMLSLGLRTMVSTHDPRRVFAQWFPIRWVIAEHPELRSHPIIQGHVNHGIFSDSALARFRRLSGDGTDDPLRVCAKIMGNRKGTQLLRTYWRGWPILLALRAALERQRMGLCEETS